jgi:leucyl aminopeptidase
MPNDLTITVASLPPEKTRGALAIYVPEGAPPAGSAKTVWDRTGLDWQQVVETSGFKGKRGHLIDLVSPPGIEAGRLLVLGSGKPADGGESSTAWTDRGGSLCGKLVALGVETVAMVLDAGEATPALVADLAAGVTLRHYRFDKYKSRRPDDAEASKPLAVTLCVADPKAVEDAVADRLATVNGTLLARNLVNEPANVLGTLEAAAEAEKLAALGVAVEVLDEPALRELGMNSLLAVSQGSARPPRLVVMQWRGGGEAAPIAFIGKGVVFDTGGLSIKSAGGMEDMKGDMGGAAAVIGLMHALASRKAAVNAVGVVGLVENMPSGTATRPGDIVRAMSGTSIEIVNTDAEGRLVLADALWYTQGRFKPQCMIDLATLTGAIIVALGHDHAGLFSNDEELAARLLAAGLASGEKLWRMPLGPAYDKLIESRFADIKNTGGRYGGAVTAAALLQRFVNDVPWAHLDIAGTGFGAGNTETSTSWASGFGVGLLDRLVRDNYEQR